MCTKRVASGTILLQGPGQPTFPEFSKQIQDVLDDFGAVFVKLNWSAPLVSVLEISFLLSPFSFLHSCFSLFILHFVALQDAAWVAPTKTLRCTTLEDVYLLLKSSDRIARDLNDLQSLRNSNVNLQPSLILKKWREINPCTEFRCFVVQGQLVGSRFLVYPFGFPFLHLIRLR